MADLALSREAAALSARDAKDVCAQLAQDVAVKDAKLAECEAWFQANAPTHITKLPQAGIGTFAGMLSGVAMAALPGPWGYVATAILGTIGGVFAIGSDNANAVAAGLSTLIGSAGFLSGRETEAAVTAALSKHADGASK